MCSLSPIWFPQISPAHIVLLMLGTAMYLRAYQDTPIEHEEHNTIAVPPPGDYKIDRVREYNHPEEETRYVAD